MENNNKQSNINNTNGAFESEPAESSEPQYPANNISGTSYTAEQLNIANNILQNINSIKDNLTKLPLNPLQLNYFDNNINPLLIILYQLSTLSLNLVNSSNALATSITVHAKESKLKDTIHLVYQINEDIEDIYKVLRKRIDTLLYLEENKKI
ncbi:hypothetical protein M2651_11390 [Clostridium sp. SYSU_GA19001]|uniref:hypothetical protein n=1 Tax=Clostridium caldaquaticum TaxID=2940653 RepID=UPI002076E853|nr:hypothetical protein [Clostridium caldaquaticum]MCM8711618.1 hypothetical protein [Clostridium caldaquaticum]